LAEYLPEMANMQPKYAAAYLAQEGVTYFNIFYLILITLVSRQVAENLVEIH